MPCVLKKKRETSPSSAPAKDSAIDSPSAATEETVPFSMKMDSGETACAKTPDSRRTLLLAEGAMLSAERKFSHATKSARNTPSPKADAGARHNANSSAAPPI